ncbi:MAG TPA: SPFH domain-containing protein [Thermoanaerobaculia bacterium]|jgi:regulator of protease activity HflC (stomatin/prohibitin superfamily)|nr:SPFH domain-containing protein [Thermoanaerobaculia bacterium]HPA53110.1 SPFH domain-containing protein [Thermoanaerobaculia bacterium]HQN10319.1 SPFH domain-containing protein [Thermoanaerobaculia bacterium]HQP88382.1 SPFH domain-containing protein [Thermoanaerobaculia bacterium]
MKPNTLNVNREKPATVHNGWTMLVFALLLLAADVALFIWSIVAGVQAKGDPYVLPFVVSLLGLPAWIVFVTGFFTLQPNEARVLVLFGDYKGTVREAGFHWGNPFYSNGSGAAAAAAAAAASAEGHGAKPAALAAQAAQAAGRRSAKRNRISLRARTLNGQRLKVNDKGGNPIEIAAVVIWRVQDTAMAMFDVDDYEQYVETQSESALRHIASLYSYDHGEEDEITLRTNVEEVSAALKTELHERLAKAGVVVEEARLTHLAYAPEIAQAMLRRQQAEAVIAARQKIVHGAVSMVEMALKELADKNVLTLDDERKASMVSNLMVVLCGDSEVHPVVNAGTLYA